MRYIGGKTLLKSDILKLIKEVAPNANTILDLFSGSGVVSKAFKEANYDVISNDYLYFSYVLLKGSLELNSKPKFRKLGFDPINYLNNLKLEDTNISIDNCFIYNNYSPNEHCDRMYFQNHNAIKIDVIRQTIQLWLESGKITKKEYFYLLASLISAVPYVSNIAGVYAAYLKTWDPRSYKTLELKDNELIEKNRRIRAYNEDYLSVLKKTKADVLYSDSPYNSREYLPNYHILETIALYDYPIIHGLTGIRDYEEKKSDFCKKNEVANAFDKMISNAKVKYVFISYNNEGLISTEDLSAICMKYAKPNTFKLLEIPYRRYKSKIKNDQEGLKEQIYYFEKKNCDANYYKSPMNYIGGKYKLLSQILPYFPSNIDTFYDVFAGGCDVSLNVKCNRIVANDINSEMIDLYNTLKNSSNDFVLNYIESTIKKYGLSISDDTSYYNFRKYYNEFKNPLDLFVLLCFSFNHQIRFNNNLEFNSPFGKNRSCYNSNIKKNLINFLDIIKRIDFTCSDYRKIDFDKIKPNDFVYFDPPYSITIGTYNDGKRGFSGWNSEDDNALFSILDKLNEKNIKFAMSNVIKHKGKINNNLVNWAKKYKVHYLNYDYNNSSYNTKISDETIEVLICNY